LIQTIQIIVAGYIVQQRIRRHYAGL